MYFLQDASGCTEFDTHRQGQLHIDQSAIEPTALGAMSLCPHAGLLREQELVALLDTECCGLWQHHVQQQRSCILLMFCSAHALVVVLLMLCMCQSEPGCLACRAALATGDFEAAAEHVSKYSGWTSSSAKSRDELDSHQLQEQRAVCPPLQSHAHSAGVARATLPPSHHRCLSACELKVSAASIAPQSRIRAPTAAGEVRRTGSHSHSGSAMGQCVVAVLHVPGCERGPRCLQRQWEDQSKTGH